MTPEQIKAVLDEHGGYGQVEPQVWACRCGVLLGTESSLVSVDWADLHRYHQADEVAALLPEATEIVEWGVRDLDRTWGPWSEATSRTHLRLGLDRGVTGEVLVTRIRTSRADTVTEWTEVDS